MRSPKGGIPEKEGEKRWKEKEKNKTKRVARQGRKARSRAGAGEKAQRTSYTIVGTWDRRNDGKLEESRRNEEAGLGRGFLWSWGPG